MGKLNGRVALITGSSKGIGQGCAMCMAREGADIVVNCRPQGAEDGRKVVAAIQAMGRKAALVTGDMGVRSDVENVFRQALDVFGHIDILVSNVAYEVHMNALDTPLEEFARSLEVSLTAGFRLAQLCASHMVQRGQGGKIVFIGSIHGEVPFPSAIAYNTAKAGLNHMARSMANELAPFRINVNVIAPGWIDTPGERRWYSEARLREIGAKLPWGRMGTPDDIGKAAVFLASDDADYVTGTVLKVDGGYTVSLSLQLD